MSRRSDFVVIGAHMAAATALQLDETMVPRRGAARQQALAQNNRLSSGLRSGLADPDREDVRRLGSFVDRDLEHWITC